MKKYFLGVSLVAFLAAGQVLAADVVQTFEPPAVAPVVVAPAFSWDGFYIGGQLGGSWTDTDASSRYYAGGTGAGVPLIGFSVDADGFVGGLYGGYNFDLGNDVIVGLETDFVWGNVDKRTGYQRIVEPLGTGTGVDVVARARLDQKWAGATRVRVGYAMDRFLLYLAGGVAYAKLKASADGWQTATGTNTPLPGTAEAFSGSDTFTGWTLGGGFDYAATDNVLLRLEYRYTDFGDKSYREDLGSGDVLGYRIDHKASDVRVGVAYKF